MPRRGVRTQNCDSFQSSVKAAMLSGAASPDRPSARSSASALSRSNCLACASFSALNSASAARAWEESALRDFVRNQTSSRCGARRGIGAPYMGSSSLSAPDMVGSIRCALGLALVDRVIASGKIFAVWPRRNFFRPGFAMQSESWRRRSKSTKTRFYDQLQRPRIRQVTHLQTRGKPNNKLPMPYELYTGQRPAPTILSLSV